MGRSGLGTRLLAAALASALGGCLFTPKPYAGDPLLHHGRGVRGDHEKARQPLRADVEPAPPRPETGILTSR